MKCFYFLSQYDFKQNSKHKNDIKIIVLLYAKLSDILSVDKYIKIIQRGRDKSEIKQNQLNFLIDITIIRLENLQLVLLLFLLGQH